MRHHSIICRLGVADNAQLALAQADTISTELSVVEGQRRLGYGLGQALDQLHYLGLEPSESAIDLALLAAAVTAADTRISRVTESQDGWTREIDLYLPVSDPALWTGLAPLIRTTLDFLTGDRWGLEFRPRLPAFATLAGGSGRLRTVQPDGVCLFSGGLDSFIGAIDLFARGANPMLVSHYWDGITSKHQTYCADVMRRAFPAVSIQHVRARVGFPNDIVAQSPAENTLRGRSFLFFALASLAASAIGGPVTVHVPENGLISLNVPLDPLRLGALSTRTTHPFFMARFGDILRGLGIEVTLDNAHRHQTKGEMVQGCQDQALLRREAKNTMSCSSPSKARWAGREPMHCGHCVPCLIRRASLEAGFDADDTVYAIPDLRARTLNTTRAEGEHVRSFQVALARLASKPRRARLDIHRPGPLIDHLHELPAYERVYLEGLREVGRLLQGVRARPL